MRLTRKEFHCFSPAWAFLFAFANACSAIAADMSPYEARVVATGASVFSGPGTSFYPTDTLAQGDIVEVYREKPGGWLAIRPPANSFSWVAAADLKLREDGLGEVTKDDVASRIGSRLSDKHNAAQVRLKKGEVVEVLDEESIGRETWYKIAPPAGEFRWMQASLLERLGGVQTVSAESKASDETMLIDATSDIAVPPLAANPPAASAPASPIVTTPIDSARTEKPPTTTVATSTPAQTVAPTAGPVADDLSRSLATIELRLSRMVAAPVNLWNTEKLEQDAAQLMSRAQSPAERDAVQVTMGKIKQFAAISQRSSQIPPIVPAGAAGPSTPQSQAPITPLPSTGVAAPSVAATGTGSYDAVGVLRPVVSRRPGAPQFALVDDRGQVLSFVTPSPDVNLQPYVGRRVGVTGNRGYITEFNRAHVTAARVAPLGTNVLR